MPQALSQLMKGAISPLRERLPPVQRSKVS
jgi:hypothetical protein